MGSGDTRAKECVQTRLLVRIKEVTTKEMSRDDLENIYPLVAPFANRTLRLDSKDHGKGSQIQ